MKERLVAAVLDATKWHLHEAPDANAGDWLQEVEGQSWSIFYDENNVMVATRLDERGEPVEVIKFGVGVTLTQIRQAESEPTNPNPGGQDMKLFAIAHDTTFDGDSGFYCPDPVVEYHEGMVLEDIRVAFVLAAGNDDFARETAQEMKGAWIVSEQGLRACRAVWEADPGNDSATYACNRAAKHVAEAICVKRVGDDAEKD